METSVLNRKGVGLGHWRERRLVGTNDEGKGAVYRGSPNEQSYMPKWWHQEGFYQKKWDSLGTGNTQDYIFTIGSAQDRGAEHGN